jgi:hypothetical protein
MPALFAPEEPGSASTDRQIAGPGHRPAFRAHRSHAAPGTAPGLLVHGDQVHDRDTYFLIDPDDGQAFKAEQPGRIVDHARGSSVVIGLPRQQA